MVSTRLQVGRILSRWRSLTSLHEVKNQADRASKTQGLDSKVKVILAFVRRQQLFRVVRESVGSQVSDGQTEL